MKAHEITTPGLYWYSRDGEPRGFALVKRDGDGFDFKPVDTSQEGGWHMCTEREKGDFLGPVPELPPKELPPPVQEIKPGLTLAVMLFPIDMKCFATVLGVFSRHYKDCVARGAGGHMFIDRVRPDDAEEPGEMVVKSTRPRRKRERLDIVDDRTAEDKRASGDGPPDQPGTYHFQDMPSGDEYTILVTWDLDNEDRLLWKRNDPDALFRDLEDDPPYGIWRGPA